MQHRRFKNQFTTIDQPHTIAPHNQLESIFTPASGSIRPSVSGPNLDAHDSESRLAPHSQSESIFRPGSSSLQPSFSGPTSTPTVRIQQLDSEKSLPLSTFVYPNLLLSTF